MSKPASGLRPCVPRVSVSSHVAASGAAATDVNACDEGAQRRLRVAFLTRRFGVRFGGAEAYGEHLVRALQGLCDVHVFCQEWDSRLVVNHTIVPRGKHLPRWLNLADFTRRCQSLVRGFDVVHTHENSGFGDVHGVHVMPVRYARLHVRHGWKNWLAVHTSPRWLGYLAMEAARMRPRPGKVIVAASELIAEQIAAAYRETAPVTVITPGVYLPRQIPEQVAARQALGLPADERIALLVANDPVRKGVETLLEALPAVPGVRLWVVGGEGDMPARVRHLAEAAGLAHRVRVWPGQSDLSNIYAAADFCVFPTRGDAFGMVPLEAMAYGLPVIMSGARYCGFARYVEPGTDALILEDPHDAQTLAQLMRQLTDDADLYAQLREHGAARARQFAWSDIARQFLAIYRQSAARA